MSLESPRASDAGSEASPFDGAFHDATPDATPAPGVGTAIAEASHASEADADADVDSLALQAAAALSASSPSTYTNPRWRSRSSREVAEQANDAWGVGPKTRGGDSPDGGHVHGHTHGGIAGPAVPTVGFGEIAAVPVLCDPPSSPPGRSQLHSAAAVAHLPGIGEPASAAVSIGASPSFVSQTRHAAGLGGSRSGSALSAAVSAAASMGDLSALADLALASEEAPPSTHAALAVEPEEDAAFGAASHLPSPRASARHRRMRGGTSSAASVSALNLSAVDLGSLQMGAPDSST